MVDHGSDAATVVANAAADITKGVLQISAAGLKQLFLLMYEGKALKVGETNIEKLIRAIDAGDKINDVTIPKEHIEQLVELSQKHGVTYAVAENTKGEMIVYFPESQSNRMTNILSDMQNEINQRSPEVDPENKEEKFDPEIKESLYSEDIKSEKTIVFFDGKNPNQHVHISQRPLKEGGCETQCFIHRQDGITELIDAATAATESYGYEQRMSFEVAGLYPESKIQSHIDKMCMDLEKQRKERDAITSKENFIDNLISKDSSLDGSLYTITDSQNSKNMIVIYKHLESSSAGEFKTANEIFVYKEGTLDKNPSPKDAIHAYSKYKVTEKHGKNALKQYERIINGDIFKEKGEKEQEQPEINNGERKTLAEYEKEVEKIRETMPRPEKTENLVETPIKNITDLADMKER